MSNYNVVLGSTGFSSKDGLAPGSALKYLQGVEIQAEFNAISTAVNSKVDASLINAANGVAGLDSNSRILSANLPFGYSSSMTGAGGFSISSTGSVTLAAPVSGNALNITAVSGALGLLVTAQSGTVNVRFTRTASDVLDFYHSGGVQIIDASAASSSLYLSTVGTSRLQIGPSGNVTITAPSSGTALTATGVAATAAISARQGPITGNFESSDVNHTNYWTFGRDNASTGNFVICDTAGTNRLTLDTSGNLGLGATPSAWSSWKVLQNQQASFSAISGYAVMAQNWYAAPADTRIAADYATQYYQHLGQHVWQTAGTSTAGSAITWTQAMTLDSSGNLGLGVTPSAWSSPAIELRGLGIGGLSTTDIRMYQNAYEGGGGPIYKVTAAASMYRMTGGGHVWYEAGSGTGGTSVSWNQAMTLDASGNLLVGTATNSPTSRFSVSATTSIACAAYGTDPSYVSTIYYGSTVRSAAAGFDFIGMYANGTQIFQVNGAGQCRVTDGTSTSLLFVGYLGLPQSSNTTLTLADRGKSITATGTITVPNSTFSGGDTVVVYNNSASPITLSASITTMRLAGTATTGSRTIAQRGWATIYFVSGTECSVAGPGVT